MEQPAVALTSPPAPPEDCPPAFLRGTALPPPSASLEDCPGPTPSRTRPVRVAMIWAQDRGGVLGSEGSMLWRVPADFRHFRASTLGGGLVMGRVTWDSLGGALAGRRNVVLTRDPLWQAAGAHRAASLEQAVALASGGLEAGLGADPRTGAAASWPRTWVIGGGSVYRQAMEAQVADLLVVSTIDLEAAGRAGGALVHAPAIDPARWGRDEEASDAPGTWRPRSGDARWRVDVWRRRTGD